MFPFIFKVEIQLNSFADHKLKKKKVLSFAGSSLPAICIHPHGVDKKAMTSCIHLARI